MIEYCLIGCGDIGRRVAQRLIAQGVSASAIAAWVNTEESFSLAQQMGLVSKRFDLDLKQIDIRGLVGDLDATRCFYFVPPQPHGSEDLRCQTMLQTITRASLVPASMVAISTTGVYGDVNGAWVDESSALKPSTDRAKRRLDMEQQWRRWSMDIGVVLRLLRVPGIYALSRLSRARLQQARPVVRASDCGFSNRIHADDLARACLAAQAYQGQDEVFNISDGAPGTSTDYLQAAAKQLGLPPLPEITLAEARRTVSAQMLSYLQESRRISNKKMRTELNVAPRYPDFRIGLRHG